MSIEAINEQLLRAIGVGVALVDLQSLKIRFRNDTFASWFGEAKPDESLSELLPDIDTQAMIDTLDTGGPYTAEATFKMRRRTMTVAVEVSHALDGTEKIAILVCQNITRIKELESMIDSYSMMVERNTLQIKREKEQVEKLLLNMMPRSAYEEYKTFGVVSPRMFDEVSVLALNFVGFNTLLEEHDAGVIVSELNDLYTAFDRIGEQFGCERIRTNGDSYLTVSGVPEPLLDHAQSVAKSAIRFIRYLNQRNEGHPIIWQARIGIATGRVVGSVVGTQKHIYDVFGPVVEVAEDLRDMASPMTVATHAKMADLLSDGFEMTECPATVSTDTTAQTLLQLTEAKPLNN